MYVTLAGVGASWVVLGVRLVKVWLEIRMSSVCNYPLRDGGWGLQEKNRESDTMPKRVQLSKR